MNFLYSFFLASKAYAAPPIPLVPSAPATTAVKSISGLSVNASFVDAALGVLGLAGIFAVCYLIWAGVRYILSGSNAENAKGARTALINGVIGVVVVVASYGLIKFAVDFGVNLNKNLYGQATVTQGVNVTAGGTGSVAQDSGNVSVDVSNNSGGGTGGGTIIPVATCTDHQTVLQGLFTCRNNIWINTFFYNMSPPDYTTNTMTSQQVWEFKNSGNALPGTDSEAPPTSAIYYYVHINNTTQKWCRNTSNCALIKPALITTQATCTSVLATTWDLANKECKIDPTNPLDIPMYTPSKVPLLIGPQQGTDPSKYITQDSCVAANFIWVDPNTLNAPNSGQAAYCTSN